MGGCLKDQFPLKETLRRVPARKWYPLRGLFSCARSLAGPRVSHLRGLARPTGPAKLSPAETARPSGTYRTCGKVLRTCCGVSEPFPFKGNRIFACGSQPSPLVFCCSSFLSLVAGFPFQCFWGLSKSTHGFSGFPLTHLGDDFDHSKILRPVCCRGLRHSPFRGTSKSVDRFMGNF